MAFASRDPILNRFRIRTPVEKHRMDAWNARFSEYETQDWRLSDDWDPEAEVLVEVGRGGGQPSSSATCP